MQKFELDYLERNKRYRNIVNASLEEALIYPDAPEELLSADRKSVV